jgi:hypothetical protein
MEKTILLRRSNNAFSRSILHRMQLVSCKEETLRVREEDNSNALKEGQKKKHKMQNLLPA